MAVSRMLWRFDAHVVELWRKQRWCCGKYVKLQLESTVGNRQQRNDATRFNYLKMPQESISIRCGYS